MTKAKKTFIQKIQSHPHTKLIATLITFFCLFLGYKIYIWSNTESTDNAYVEADISNVSSEISGVIGEIYVKENMPIGKGQVIAKIIDDDYRANLIKTESLLQSAEHEIAIIEKNSVIATIEKDRAQDAYEFARANFKNASSDYNRIKELSKDNYASKKNLGNSHIAFEKAKNDLSQSSLNMQKSTEDLALLEIKRLAAVANHMRARQEKLLAKRALDNTEIRSPIDGVLGNNSLREGSFVQRGMILFSAVPINDLYIEANFKETQISKLKPGMEVKIIFDSEPSEKISGVIRAISPATGAKFSLLPPANATGNFTKIVQRVPVIIDFQIPDNLKNKIIPGMSSLVKIRTY